MTIKQLVPGVYAIPLGPVNAYLINDGDPASGSEPSLTLIDTGIPGSAERIMQAVRELGRQPADIRHILVTHCHADHSGSLAALKAATGAATYMHAEDAALVRVGQSGRTFKPAPGLLQGIVFRLFRPGPVSVEAAEIDHEPGDGDELPVAGGIRAIHVPGHCAGQLAFLWPRHGGVLFAADAAANLFGRLDLSIVYEDVEEGRRSLAKLSALDFEVACFGHGKAIIGGAAERFRRKWRPAVARPSGVT